MLLYIPQLYNLIDTYPALENRRFQESKGKRLQKYSEAIMVLSLVRVHQKVERYLARVDQQRYKRETPSLYWKNTCYCI